MKRSYFKIRGKFDFSPHRFEIGNPLIQSWHFNHNYLFKKIYLLPVSDYAAFYDYHLQYFLNANPDQQQSFFEHLSRIISERIAYYKLQDPFSSRQKIYQSNLIKLDSFQSFLRSIDQWHVFDPLESVIAEKDRLIDQLTVENAQLKELVKEMKAYDTTEKINIVENHLGTFIDLIQQMQLLKLNENKKLLNVQTKSAWYKLLSRYFLHGGNPIPLETARNYFSVKDNDDSGKGTKVKDDHKLFIINQMNTKK
ncbi:hypothetical protein ACFP1I_22250 [Dyadobacter subterraneus]|uniref:Uncharacterized protein n=1 Tax=Dyadobacter subterraneus TaxID=2773304 RepID=A0ABR9WJC0_9BACT|nr:hypothetical protein [Dyadobacter subterraneus]MBE9465512.1 hypothetical protein [Dyadobacter subterraneus]